MKFHVLTLFPEMFVSVLQTSILKRIQEKNLIEIVFYNLRDFGKGKYHQVDDLPYGGGAGMVMMPEPLSAAILAAKAVAGPKAPVFYMSAQGKRLKQTKVEKLTKHTDIVLLCGHYEGIDQRIIDLYIDEEISIGDYVLTGGELPALILIDSISRLLPGALGSDQSVHEESFSKELDRKREYPHYTRPEVFQDLKVPEVLLSGHHAKIAKWRRENLK
ncbi:tRNA (guanosine(37)-N1)-methyltransferase TrmD [Candidatus Gracilibacteria bacterium]|nr:tRNA (guanosine(37)-N1)-methyltransferase TrmD [Candidatus Gracilibacteria bacterium]